MTRSCLRLSRSASAEAGFTLLEGLVAIALLAGTMFAIFTLVGGVLNSANRVGLSNETAQVTLNALEVMSVVNPMLQDTGKIDLGPYTVSWKSAATTPVADGVGYPSASAFISSHSTRPTCGSKGREERCWRSSIFARSATAGLAIRRRRSGRACLVSQRATADRDRISDHNHYHQSRVLGGIGNCAAFASETHSGNALQQIELGFCRSNSRPTRTSPVSGT